MIKRIALVAASFVCLSLVAACEEDDAESAGTGGSTFSGGGAGADTGGSSSGGSSSDGGSAGPDIGGGSGTGGSTSGSVDCAKLCADKSLGCPNDDDCPNQCADFRSVCTEEADAVIACNYSRPTSDFECNTYSMATAVKAGVCAAEQTAYNTCRGNP